MRFLKNILDTRFPILDSRKSRNEYQTSLPVRQAGSIEHPNDKLIVNFFSEAAQSVVEYCIMFSVVVAVLVLAINGPIRNSLNASMEHSIDVVNTSIRGVIR